MDFKIDIHSWFIFTVLFLSSLAFLIAWYVIIPFFVRKRQLERTRQKVVYRNKLLIHIEAKIDEKELVQLEKRSSLLKSNLSEELIDALKSNAENISETFFIQFNQIYPQFNTQLTSLSSGMTEYELKLCALLKLNLTSKEISKLMNITPASVNKARYRIRKKLNIQTGVNLHTFFTNL